MVFFYLSRLAAAKKLQPAQDLNPDNAGIFVYNHGDHRGLSASFEYLCYGSAVIIIIVQFFQSGDLGPYSRTSYDIS